MSSPTSRAASGSSPKWGYVEVVEERPGRRRGAAIEHVYRAIRRAHFDTSDLGETSRAPGETASASRSILDSYRERIGEAVEAGTFDQELDRHLSWDAVALDRPAWTEAGRTPGHECSTRSPSMRSRPTDA